MKMLSCFVASLLAPLPLVVEASPTLLPPGMARADQPEAVAALYSPENEERAKAIRNEPERELTAQEQYHLQLIAYRQQLVEAQEQRKIRELELQLEREARIRAEERAAQAERERRRESIYLQHHSVHAYQRNLNDEYWREQRLRKIIEKECNKPTSCQPIACPAPAPAPAPTPAPASDEESSSGQVLP